MAQKKTRIEVTLDSTNNSRVLRAYVFELRRFLEEADKRTGEHHEVVLRDTAQLFHEKTGYLHTGLTPDRIEDWMQGTASIYRALEDGRYEVEPPVHGEARYYNALRRFVFEVAKLKEPDLLAERAIEAPEQIDEPLLQYLYLEHVHDFPRSSPLRKLPEFKAFNEVRHDLGEDTYKNFLADFAASADVERTVSFFVSRDGGAKKNTRKVGNRISRDEDSPHQAHVGQGKYFRQVVREMVKLFKEQHPECADIAFDPDPVVHQRRAFGEDSPASERAR